MWYQKSMTGERFENWMEHNMLQCIGSGKRVIMDNARLHRKKQLEEICERARVGLLFLPPYSPDFNLIEKEWANKKRKLRDTAPFMPYLKRQYTNTGLRACSKSGILALHTPKFYLAGSKRAQKSGFLRSITTI
jgi:hypothetical protein